MTLDTFKIQILKIIFSVIEKGVFLNNGFVSRLECGNKNRTNDETR